MSFFTRARKKTDVKNVTKDWSDWNAAHSSENAVNRDDHMKASQFHQGEAAKAKLAGDEKGAQLHSSAMGWHGQAALAMDLHDPAQQKLSQWGRDASVEANKATAKKDDKLISVMKHPLPGNPLQSDPKNTDTMEEDATVNSLQTPMPWSKDSKDIDPVPKPRPSKLPPSANLLSMDVQAIANGYMKDNG